MGGLLTPTKAVATKLAVTLQVGGEIDPAVDLTGVSEQPVEGDRDIGNAVGRDHGEIQAD